MIHTIATLETSHADSFIDNIHTIIGNARFLILFYKEVRARLELEQRKGRPSCSKFLTTNMLRHLSLCFHLPEIVFIHYVMLATNASIMSIQISC